MRRIKPFEIVVSFLLLTIYGVQTAYFYFLSDDSFISFRYARNLVEGHGLAWNPGQFVEGYTNFLWTLMMAAVLKLNLAPELWSNIISISCALLLLFLISNFARKRITTNFIWLFPLSVCAVSRSFPAWSSSGLETMLFALLLFAASSSLLDALQNRGTLLWSACLFLLLCLCRPEGLLFSGFAFCFIAYSFVKKDIGLKSGFTWVFPLMLGVGVHFLWRHAYYGEWLPNTFYAKVPGLWFSQGFRYLSLIQSDYQFGWFMPCLLIVPLIKRDKTSLYFSLIILLQLLYVLAIGGDRFEFRFLVPFFGFYLLLIAEALDIFWQRYNQDASLTFVVVVLWFGLLGTTLYGSHKKSASKQRYGVASIQGIRRYATSRAWEGKFLRRLVEKKLIPNDTILCVGGAGALPYYSRLTTIDRRGLSDHYLARLPLTHRGIIAH
ncbi:MAG: hypothetical protein KDD62_09880, partial [Bdellovibrionales bacterium]|nr:hypothetical protein [Bdellovibrionales bacterium]